MTQNKDDFYERLTEAIERAADSGEIITKWFTAIEIIDSDGDRGVYTIQSEDATPWDVLGLLAYADQKMRSKIDVYTWVTHDPNPKGEGDDD